MRDLADEGVATKSPAGAHLRQRMSDATHSSQRFERSDLEALYARLEKPLFNVVYRWLWDREETLDVVQEAFVRVWRKRDEVDGTTVEALVYRVALNLASNRRRARKVWRWVSLEALWDRSSAAVSAEERLAGAERERALRDAVDALPEDLRRVVMLCEYSELSQREIGELLGIPPGTVGSRRHRALAALRAELGDGRGDPDRGQGGLRSGDGGGDESR